VGRGTWPAWATGPVVIAAADPAWSERGRAACDLLGDVLRPWLTAEGVQHVGSTAVPGLAAKPILDLMAGVGTFDHAAAVAAALAPRGWHLVPPDLDARPWRRLLVEVRDGRRAAHLHLLQPDDHRWSEQLRFRDLLRADPALADRYATLKQRAAAAHPHDREAYTAAKTTFVRDTLARS